MAYFIPYRESCFMALPLLSVVKALFESYVDYRKTKWGINENTPPHELIKKIPQQKLNALIALLTQAEEAKSTQDWIRLIYNCAEKKQIEDDNRLAKKFLGLGGLLFKDKPTHLGIAILAIQSYVISKIIDNPAYADTQKSLEREKSELNKSIKNDKKNLVDVNVIEKNQALLNTIEKQIIALNESKKFIDSYFKSFILSH